MLQFFLHRANRPPDSLTTHRPTVNKIIILKKNEDLRLVRGHLWAFSNEIQEIKGGPVEGDVVELRTNAGKFIGLGFYNPHSLISIRLLTRKEESIDSDFFARRIESSLRLRQMLYPDATAYRVVHGESDFLPGLIVDKYNDLLSVQTFSWGMDARLSLICDVLDSLLHPAGIVQRNDSSLRTLEGLPLVKEIVRGSLHQTTIDEHGISYDVDLLGGQKTGFFLDQRENRKAIRRFSNGARVLDCFCNEGGFALNAVVAGARSVTAVDISEHAITKAKENARRNNLGERITFITGDGFEFLKAAHGRGEQFDVVNLDPPSFAKNRKAVAQAKRGYRDLHTLAFQVLKPGGILTTASCSHHIFPDTFLSIISDAARSLGRELSVLEWGGAAPDHPVLPAMPETQYLKFGILRVL